MSDCFPQGTLPCSNTVSSSSTSSLFAFAITNKGGGGAVKGVSTEGIGLWGESSDGGYGVFGQSKRIAVYGELNADFGIAVYGKCTGDRGFGVYGQSNDTGVYGSTLTDNEKSNSAAVEGQSNRGNGVLATSNSGYAVIGASNRNIGVYGINDFGGNTGVYGLYRDLANSGSGNGVYGESKGLSGNGVVGVANNGTVAFGIWGRSNTGYAGFFSGKVLVTGTLIKGGGGFKIDHPLDSANKYLSHSFVESPDMKTIYDGVAVLDDSGEVIVELPAWFEALNKDFRYQLTCIGGHAQVYIAQEIERNFFKIAGGRSGMKVSWQVSGIRQDAWANANRIPVEEEKCDEERGYYLHPVPHGEPEERSIEWAYNPELMSLKETPSIPEPHRASDFSRIFRAPHPEQENNTTT